MSTRIDLNAGRYCDTSSSSFILPCSIIIIAATDVTALVIEAMRKIESAASGTFFAGILLAERARIEIP